MKQIKLIFGLGIIATMIVACSTTQPLTREVRASINKDFQIDKTVTGDANFANNSTDEEYRAEVIKDITTNLANKKIVVTDENPEYRITIEKVEIIETLTQFTVNDTTVKNNGSVWALSKVVVTVKGFVTAASGVGTVYPFVETKTKEEKATKSRGSMQYIKGENMHSDEYREKKFNEKEVQKMIGSCAYNAGKRIAKDIIKDVGTL
jgi:hypothetical protein